MEKAHDEQTRLSATDLQSIGFLLQELVSTFSSLLLALEDLLIHTGGRYFRHLGSTFSCDGGGSERCCAMRVLGVMDQLTDLLPTDFWYCFYAKIHLAELRLHCSDYR